MVGWWLILSLCMLCFLPLKDYIIHFMWYIFWWPCTHNIQTLNPGTSPYVISILRSTKYLSTKPFWCYVQLYFLIQPSTVYPNYNLSQNKHSFPRVGDCGTHGMVLSPVELNLYLHICVQLGKRIALQECRTILVILCVAAAHGVWILEQPNSSLITRHRRFQWLVRRFQRMGVRGPWIDHLCKSTGWYSFSQHSIIQTKSYYNMILIWCHSRICRQG